MKKTIIALFAVVLVGAGCSMQSEDFVIDNSPEPLIVSAVLNIDENDEPTGYSIVFEGFLDKELTTFHGVQPLRGELIDGTIVHSESYYWAGMESELLYVREGDTLQLQRQVTFENERAGESPEVLEPEFIYEIELDPGTRVLFE